MNANFAVGVSSGLADLPERIRDRKLEDENRALALSDRDRRITREDEVLGRERERFDHEKQQWANQDADRAYTDEKRGWEREDRSRELSLRDRGDAAYSEDREHSLYQRDRQKKLDSRADYEWSQSLEHTQRKMREVGMDRLLSALERGADPAMAEREFNAGSDLQIAPGSLKYDPQSMSVSFSGPGGNKFEGHIDQLKAIFSAPSAPMKLGANDRIVDPKTGRDIIPPSSGAGGAGQTKWNAQTASDRAADVVREAMGARFDAGVGAFLVPPDKAESIAYGSSLAGRVVRHFGQRITAEEAGQIAFSVAKKIPTVKEAETMARERGKVSPQDIKSEASKIIGDARVKAAQYLASALQEKETELEQQEQQEQQGGQAGASGSGGGQQQRPSFGPPPNLLKEGTVTTFRNGQKWTLQGGKPVQVQ